MKKLLYIITICICSFFVAHAVQADTLKLSKYVTDNANVIPDDAEALLEAKLTDFDVKTGNQFVIVTMPNLPGGNTIEFTAHDIFEKNQIGQKGKNNGLLFLLSTGERQTRYEVGYGLEPIFPDILAGRILREEVSPFLKSGDFVAGMNAVVDKAIEVITKGKVYENITDSNTVKDGQYQRITPDFLMGILFIILFIFRVIFQFFAKSKSVVAGGVFGAIIGLIGFLITGVIYMFGFILVGILLDWLASTVLGKKLSHWSRPRVGSWGGGGWSSGGNSGGFSGGGGSSGGGGASSGY